MPNRRGFDNLDPSLTDDEFEEELVLLDEEELEVERDLATEGLYDTQHSDGHTYNPHEAMEQGLTYTPPEDPPILPSDNLQGAEMGAGFAQSMEDTDASDEILPSSVDNNDSDLETDIYFLLRSNSETMHLTDITVRVEDGIVTLLGTVPGDEDLALIDEVLSDVAGIVELRYRLDTYD